MSLFVYPEHRLTVDNYPILYKQEYPAIMLLFTESEKVEGKFQYQTTVEKFVDRLEKIFGYTLDKTKRSFEKSTRDRISKLQSKLEYGAQPILGLPVTNQQNFRFSMGEKPNIEKEISFLQRVSMDSHISAFKKMREHDWLPLDLLEKVESETIDDEVNYLRARSPTPWRGSDFPDACNFRLKYLDPDIFCYLRAYMASCKGDDLVTVDFSTLSHQIPLNTDKMRDFFINGFTAYNSHFSKILVITEGSTDAEILSRAIKLRYSHLSEYYLFMPYTLKKEDKEEDEKENKEVINGSASLTVQRIEAFARCEISNRIIGLLDNDKASVDAKNGVKITLPQNIKLINYPNIALAETYPCAQSNGSVKNENVNGRAAAIEMYCGRDVLTDTTTNKLYPIQWTKQPNQGNFGSKKGAIQTKILHKLDICEKNHTEINNYDWSDIDAIFEALFRCFQE